MVNTEHAPRRQQFHVAPCHVNTYTASVDVQMRCVKLVTYSESHTSRAQWVFSEAENIAVVKCLGLSTSVYNIYNIYNKKKKNGNL